MCSYKIVRGEVSVEVRKIIFCREGKRVENMREYCLLLLQKDFLNLTDNEELPRCTSCLVLCQCIIYEYKKLCRIYISFTVVSHND